MGMSLILASASPRRAELLRAAGVRFEVLVVDADETRLAGERADRYVERVAGLKAAAAVEQRPDAVVLAADTAVVVDGDVFGKPSDAAEATRMLRRLSGRAHEVLTGVVIVSPARRVSLVETTTVWLAPLSDEELAWYVASGEPMDKAGGYAVQGLASRFVTRIEGSYTNVVGLPVARVCASLAELARPGCFDAGAAVS